MHVCISYANHRSIFICKYLLFTVCHRTISTSKYLFVTDIDVSTTQYMVEDLRMHVLGSTWFWACTTQYLVLRPCGLLGVDVVSRVKTRRLVLSKRGGWVNTREIGG